MLCSSRTHDPSVASAATPPQLRWGGTRLHFVGPSIAYIVIRQGVKCRMAAKAFDEMNSGAADSVRAPYRSVADWLARTSPEKIAATRHEVDLFYRRHGITFGAYGAVDGAETTIPFDIIPRVIAWHEWEHLHKGLVQRVRALNAFLSDAYGEREICRAGIIPERQVLMNAEFVAMAQGLDLLGGVHAHIAGIDLVRVGEKDFYVLEDVKILLADPHEVDAGDVGVHAAQQVEPLRHGHELGVHQHLPLGDDAGAADLALAVGVGQEGIERTHALHQALVQVLPLVPGDDPRDDVEGDRRLGAVDRAVSAEGDAVAAIEEVDLVARRRDLLRRRPRQPIGNAAVGRADGVRRAGIHLVKCLGRHPAFHPLANHNISNRRANKVEPRSSPAKLGRCRR